MSISDARAEFPAIDGYVMHNRIDCLSTESIVLWFHKPSPDLSSMTNVQVFLIGASMKAVNVEMSPFFPEMKSYAIREESVGGKPRNLLDIVFDKGKISFRFEKVFHVKSSQPLGRVPERLKKRLALR
ncbi:MAG: hypothetical protein ACKVRO_13580 [Micropepsaceae bacterium]